MFLNTKNFIITIIIILASQLVGEWVLKCKLNFEENKKKNFSKKDENAFYALLFFLFILKMMTV